MRAVFHPRIFDDLAKVMEYYNGVLRTGGEA
jgi:hypothetical protein